MEGKDSLPITPPSLFSSVLSYTERDQYGSYTMCAGDVVSFRIATDKRDGSTRAAKVSLVKLVEELKQNKIRERVSMYPFVYCCLFLLLFFVVRV